ncbi:RHS repeat-associated core domain-containing protein, partial [Pseudomonas antarctica]
NGQTASYRYDPFGRRISKTVDGITTEFFWQGDKLVAEHHADRHRSYIYEPDSFRPLALLAGFGPQDTQPFHYQLDHLGTPQELTAPDGEIVWSAHYRAYGQISRLDINKVDNPLRFQGQYFDPESGLHYNRNRYYNPDIGRYLTPDPVKLAGGINAYQYAPNPTGWVDPLGLSCKVGGCPGSNVDPLQSSKAPVLDSHEKSGGHLIRKHIDQTDAQLTARLESEPNIPAASTFRTLEEAEALVSKSLATHNQDILEFLKGKKDKLIIRENSSQAVGVSVIRGTDKSVPAYKFLLVLKRKHNMPKGYLLLTGYPLEK